MLTYFKKKVYIKIYFNFSIFSYTNKKQPSPSTNPTIQLGFISLGQSTLGIITGFILNLGANKESSDKPLFIEALIFTISCNPYNVKCFFFFH